MKFYPLIFMLFFGFLSLNAQDLDQRINQLETAFASNEDKNVLIQGEMEELKLARIRRDLEQVGFPRHHSTDQIVKHTAMVLGYDEEHEQARWVSHIITPDILLGNLSRTNDFRVDLAVRTHTAIKADYWDSGYDRGHLAPSADFRWSKTAISESYLYSNMSPQHPDLNRKIWAELENKLREVVYREKEQLWVVTGGILRPGLDHIGIHNEVSIPKYFYKVAMDKQGDEYKGIGFIIPNKLADYPLMSYAVTIDSVERLTGIDFFPSLSAEEESQIEAATDISKWQNEVEKTEALPIDMEILPKGYVNTVALKYHINGEIGICGTVVSTKYHQKSGGTFLNLDKKFPNQVFSVTIWKDARTSFSYQPETYLLQKKVCITGPIKLSRGTPTMNVITEEQIELLSEVLK